MSPSPSGFPTLQPAIITKVNIGDVQPLGVIHTGSKLTHYGTPSGTIGAFLFVPPGRRARPVWGSARSTGGRSTADPRAETVPGYEPAFKATVNFGADWLSFDPDGQHGRIDLRGMAKTDDGHAIDFRYVGVIRMTEAVHKIFDLSPEMATVPFGQATGAHTFLVADPALKALENSVFVSNGRIIVSATGLTVETRQSVVVASTDMD